MLYGWIFAWTPTRDGNGDVESSLFCQGATLFQKLRGVRQKVRG